MNRIILAVGIRSLNAIDLDTRDTLWIRDGSFTGITPSLFEGKIHAVETGNLLVLDEFTGEDLWRFWRVSTTAGQPMVTRDFVYISSSKKVYAIDQNTHEYVWQSGFEEPFGWLSMAHDRLYVSSPNGIMGIYRSVLTDVDDEDIYRTLPDEFALHQNYPNPFNPATIINLSLPHSTAVTLTVFNILGQSVRVLVDETLPAGS